MYIADGVANRYNPISKELKDVKTMGTMTHEERHEWLKAQGGCGNCVYWNDKPDRLDGLVVRCEVTKYKLLRKPRQVYDYGCVYHNKRKSKEK